MGYHLNLNAFQPQKLSTAVCSFIEKKTCKSYLPVKCHLKGLKWARSVHAKYESLTTFFGLKLGKYCHFMRQWKLLLLSCKTALYVYSEGYNNHDTLSCFIQITYVWILFYKCCILSFQNLSQTLSQIWKITNVSLEKTLSFYFQAKFKIFVSSEWFWHFII